MKALKLFIVLLALVAMVTPTLASEPLGLESLQANDAVSAASVSASDVECVDMAQAGAQGKYVVCFLGVDYNSDGTSTWTYSLENVGAQNLSHWVLGTCEEPLSSGSYSVIAEYNGVTSNPQGRNYPMSWGQDPKAFGQGVDVFKFDETKTADGETEIFQFTMDGAYGEGTIDIATKSGENTGIAFNTITGPDCDSTVQPTPEPEPTDTPEPSDTPEPEPTPTQPSTAVTLKSFTTEMQGNVVIINWETATETDNAGFNIYRVALDGTMVKVNGTGLIGASADATAGSIYSITDTPGFGSFTYVLEDIDFNGISTRYDSAQVQLLPLRSPLYRPTFAQ